MHLLPDDPCKDLVTRLSTAMSTDNVTPTSSSPAPMPPKTPTRPRRGALRMLRYALWPALLVVSFLLYERGLELARAAGCSLGETCVSGAGLEASMYVASAVLMWMVLAIYLVALLLWKVWTLAFSRTSNKPSGGAL